MKYHRPNASGVRMIQPSLPYLKKLTIKILGMMDTKTTSRLSNHTQEKAKDVAPKGKVQKIEWWALYERYEFHERR